MRQAIVGKEAGYPEPSFLHCSQTLQQQITLPERSRNDLGYSQTTRGQMAIINCSIDIQPLNDRGSNTRRGDS